MLLRKRERCGICCTWEGFVSHHSWLRKGRSVNTTIEIIVCGKNSNLQHSWTSGTLSSCIDAILSCDHSLFWRLYVRAPLVYASTSNFIRNACMIALLVGKDEPVKAHLKPTTIAVHLPKPLFRALSVMQSGRVTKFAWFGCIAPHWPCPLYSSKAGEQNAKSSASVLCKYIEKRLSIQ